MNGVPNFLGLKFQVTLTEFKTIHKRRRLNFLGGFLNPSNSNGNIISTCLFKPLILQVDATYGWPLIARLLKWTRWLDLLLIFCSKLLPGMGAGRVWVVSRNGSVFSLLEYV